MVILAVDLGAARTGLAVRDSRETVAFPRGIIKEYNKEKLYKSIAEKAKEEKAELIVIGLPKNMDGSEGFKAEESYQAVAALKELTDLPIELWDERCTTISAHISLQMNGIETKKRKNVVDSVAATIILEDYLNYRKNKSV